MVSSVATTCAPGTSQSFLRRKRALHLPKAVGAGIVALLSHIGAFAAGLEAVTFQKELTFFRNIMDCRAPSMELLPALHAESLGDVHVAYSSDAANFIGVLSSMLSLSRHVGDPAG
eukprot:TRINITY_DN75866_c0_g1_i1.p1 TRINITY_DN75866_c0_g1~~TRINITY_DN75866_c0_g1_i1.p1  ORF type:complete len:116 (+),score=20.61 TRINITY_DN75866_c0_g1_i1:37-384(+)